MCHYICMIWSTRCTQKLRCLILHFVLAKISKRKVRALCSSPDEFFNDCRDQDTALLYCVSPGSKNTGSIIKVGYFQYRSPSTPHLPPSAISVFIHPLHKWPVCPMIQNNQIFWWHYCYVEKLISDGNYEKYRNEVIRLVDWYVVHDLELNVNKTKVISDLRKSSTNPEPLTIDSQTVELVSWFRFLGTLISEDLCWNFSSSSSCSLRIGFELQFYFQKLSPALTLSAST